MLHIKDMVACLHGKRRSSPFALHAAPGAVRDGNADGMEMLMSQLREEKAKEAFVLNEYGKFVGLVTLERLLGEMVGDIDDEFIRSGEKVEYLA